MSIAYAVSGALLTDLLPARLRYSGVALSPALSPGRDEVFRRA